MDLGFRAATPLTYMHDYSKQLHTYTFGDLSQQKTLL